MNLSNLMMIGILLVVSIIPATRGAAAEPKWTSRVVKVGEDRQETNSTDIIERPYRPLHFYGNTVRRLHYRGAARPTVEDLRMTARMILRRDGL